MFMFFITTSIVKEVYSAEYVNINLVDFKRVDNNIIERTHNYMDYIYKYSELYKIEPWIITGIIINESNSLNLISKSGYDHGLGQIRCFTKDSGKKGFSWYNYLSSKGLIKSCSDLLIPEINIKCVAEILSYIRQNYKKKHDRHLLTYYHKGVRWKTYDKGYYSRVYVYGKYSMSQYLNRRIQLCF